MKYSIEQYDRVFKQVCEEFISTYYTWDDGSISEWYIIGEWGRLAPDIIEVNDTYWSINNMYEALKNDIPRDKLIERYDYAFNKHQLKKQPVNLTSYALGVKPYTEEERLADEEKIKESFRLLQERANNNNEKLL